jgi:hypothetical protein
MRFSWGSSMDLWIRSTRHPTIPAFDQDVDMTCDRDESACVMGPGNPRSVGLAALNRRGRTLASLANLAHWEGASAVVERDRLAGARRLSLGRPGHSGSAMQRNGRRGTAWPEHSEGDAPARNFRPVRRLVLFNRGS